MQFLICVIDDQTGTASEAEIAAIDVFNERLQANGQWVFAGGLGAPATASTIDNRRGRGLIVDGPFLETKEYIAGFWIIESPDRQTADRLAAEGSMACNRRVEVRPFLL